MIRRPNANIANLTIRGERLISRSLGNQQYNYTGRQYVTLYDTVTTPIAHLKRIAIWLDTVYLRR